MKYDHSWIKKGAMMGICLAMMLSMAACQQSAADSEMTEPSSSFMQEYAPEETLPVATTEGQREEMTATEDSSATEGVEEKTSPLETTEVVTTEISTTEAPTTEAPTTEAPTTEAPTTEAPTTEAPTTEAPTTAAPTTEAPTTEAPTTETPTTEASTTEAPTTEAPTVQSVTAKVKGSYYIGDTLSAADFSITVTMSDGSTRKNPAGWSADKLYLDAAENQITITYQGVSTTITVHASERPVETEPPVTEPSEEAPTEDSGSSDSGMSLRRSAAEEAFRIQNDLIVQNGGTPVVWSETFYQQACQRAKEIVNNFSHDGFYDTTAYAENIAMGSYDANVMVMAWYNSDGHRNNMLHGWTYGAIACYGYYWVALFGPTPG